MKLDRIPTFVILIFGLFCVQSCKKSEPTPPERLKPETPTSLEALPKSAEQIQLIWVDNSDNEARFDIERSESNNKNFQKVATVNQNVSTYQDDKLKPNTVYFYRIKAVTSADFASEYSNEAKAQTEINLNKPMGLRAEATSAEAVQLMWIDNNDKETAYKIERSVNDESNFVEIAIVEFDITNYRDTEVQEKTKYFYRIQAVNIVGQSPYSDLAVAETPESRPNAPKNVKATALSTTETKITWEDASDDESFFELERAKNEPKNFKLIQTIGANTTSAKDKDLEPATTYHYRLRAKRNPSTYSDYSPTVEVQTRELPPDAPSDLKAKALSTSSVLLTWTDNSEGESGFQVFRSEDVNATFLKVGQVLANSTTYEDKNLKPNTTYYYKVKAFNSNGLSASSKIVAVFTPDHVPTSPSDLKATKNATNAVQLTWKDNSINEESFIIEQSTDNKNFKTIFSASKNETSAQVSDLLPNTTYYFRLLATNGAGNSGYSNVVSVKIPQVLPNKPTDLDVRTVSSSQLKMKWSDNSNNETGFIIYRSSSYSGPFSEIARLAKNVNEYFDKNLKPNRSYHYQVASYNEKGISEVSDTKTGYTSDGRPTTPNLIRLNPISGGRVEMTYQETSIEGTKVILEVSEKNPNLFVKHLEFPSKQGEQMQIVANLKGKTEYYFRLKSTNANYSSGYSRILAVTTTEAPPIAPSEFTAVATSSTSVALKWRDNAKDETGFKLERSLNGVSFVLLADLGKDITTYTDNGLVENATYFYRIKSYNTLGSSVFSKVVKAQTPIKGAPVAPSGMALKAVTTPVAVEITWKDNSDNETGFRVERKTQSGSYKIITSLPANTTRYMDADIVGNTLYYYRVTAFNATANSTPTEEKSIAVNTIPKPPYGVTGSYTSSPQRVVLSWKMLNYESIKKSNGLDGFKIERSENSNNNFVLLKTVNEDILNYTDTNINGGRIYYYRVKAFNQKGDSDPSAEWAIQTQ